jgi:hypothetical protein
MGRYMAGKSLNSKGARRKFRARTQRRKRPTAGITTIAGVIWPYVWENTQRTSGWLQLCG